MKSAFFATIFALCFASRAFAAESWPFLFESAALGPMAQPVDQTVVITPNSSYLCARFQISHPTLVDHVGALMRRFPSSQTVSLFAAIASINSSTGFPELPPSQFQPLAVTSFDLTSGAYADWNAPLSVWLPPGDYAVIFGSGRFGVTGRAVMYHESPDTAQASYFAGVFNAPDGRNDVWAATTDHNLRFVVTGMSVPEPSTALLAVCTFALLEFRYRRSRRDRVF